MAMKELFTYVLLAALVIHVLLIAVAFFRVWRGEHVLDRIVAADVIGTLVLAIFVIMALVQGDQLFMDLALGFAVPSFVGTIALARYIANRQMF
jgi:multisubunit Na+/H+ antiporter MnhF subunit